MFSTLRVQMPSSRGWRQAHVGGWRRAPAFLWLAVAVYSLLTLRRRPWYWMPRCLVTAITPPLLSSVRSNCMKPSTTNSTLNQTQTNDFKNAFVIVQVLLY